MVVVSHGTEMAHEVGTMGAAAVNSTLEPSICRRVDHKGV
jgi:hypothetical protein